VKAIQDTMEKQKLGTTISAHSDSMFAGAIGAALWGAFRYEKLQRLGQLPKVS
jgi:benzoyl-CoA reductase subunit D